MIQIKLEDNFSRDAEAMLRAIDVEFGSILFIAQNKLWRYNGVDRHVFRRGTGSKIQIVREICPTA